MNRLTRIFIKTSLFYLTLAMAIGVIQGFAGKGVVPLSVAYLRPVYFHLFMVGWVTQLIFGMAYWMLPKYSRESPRGNERLAWGVYWLLNTGLLLRMFAEPMYGWSGDAPWGWALALSAVLQWLAGMTFVALSWPRLRGR